MKWAKWGNPKELAQSVERLGDKVSKLETFREQTLCSHPIESVEFSSRHFYDEKVCSKCHKTLAWYGEATLTSLAEQEVDKHEHYKALAAKYKPIKEKK